MSTNGTMKDRLTTGFIRFFEKWTPNSMVFAFLLTIVVGILALLFTPTPLLFTSAEGQLSLVDAWVQGFWNLLTFAMQMALIMITGSVVATAPPVKRALHRLAYVPNSPFSAIMLILLVTGITYWIHWGVGMMFSRSWPHPGKKATKSISPLLSRFLIPPSPLVSACLRRLPSWALHPARCRTWWFPTP